MSVRSVLFRRTYGRTYCVGSNRICRSRARQRRAQWCAVPHPLHNYVSADRQRVDEALKLSAREPFALDDATGTVHLASVLAGGCQILYVLHTTRTGAQLGRYESPELDLERLRQFFQEFGKFLSEDSRHDVWLHSHVDDATIVLDRHNLIYAYGPIDAFAMRYADTD